MAASARALALTAAAPVVRRWAPHSRLFLVGERGVEWAIAYELRALARLATSLGVRLAPERLLGAARGQSVFYGSQFVLLDGSFPGGGHRVGTAYFHGRPGTPDAPEFDRCFETLRRRHREIERVQVSHSELEEIVLSSGIDAAKVFRIPIAIEIALFPQRTGEQRSAARAALGLPQDAFVVGSFLKDGVGWGEGTEPKPIKGPDVLLDALGRAAPRIPELHVLLGGPARGYVRDGLERLGIPHVHRYVADYAATAELYRACDACLIASRQEGGPKMLFEAMATGVPVVTTRVGQAMDVVRDGENGWIVPVEDADALAERLVHVAGMPSGLDAVVEAGRRTAEANAYDAQLPLWDRFMDGFVDRA